MSYGVFFDIAVIHPFGLHIFYVCFCDGRTTSCTRNKRYNRISIGKRQRSAKNVPNKARIRTGKTHTIANLISHFLAQGKRILITSQTNKALRVLKDKIPEPLQPLCVAMLDDSSEDMEHSVDGIVEYITTHKIEQARQRAESRRKQRNDLKQKLNAEETLVRQIRHMEFEPIAWCGDSLSPAKAAALIAAQVDKLDIIPGYIAEGEPFPLTEAELNELYVSNGLIDVDEETELNQCLPDANAMIPPNMAARFWKNAENMQERLYEISEGSDRHYAWSQEGYNIIDSYTGTTYAHSGDAAFIEKLKALYNQYPEVPTKWMIRAVVDGADSGLRKRRWDVLLDSIHSTCDLAQDAQKALTGHTLTIAPGIDIPTLAAQYDQLCQLASEKGKIIPFMLLGRKKLKGAIDAVILDGRHPSTYGEIRLILQWLTLKIERDHLVCLWDELMVPLGQPSATVYGSAPEEMLQQTARDLRFWLTWATIGYPVLVRTIQQAGINLSVFSGLEHANLTNEQIVTSILSELHGQIGKALVMADCIMLLSEPARRTRDTQVLLNRYEDSALCRLQLKAILEHDAEAYAQHYAVLVDVTSKKPLLIRRHELLGKIKQVAPMWAEAINQRAGIHGLAEIPENITESWHLKQLDIIVQRICTTPLTDAERRVSRLKAQYQNATEALATDMAWYLLSKRIVGDLRIQSTLIGWKQTMKRIGKGTGKNAGALRKQAQELMAASQQAVPAWIMPIGKVMDCIDPSQVKFDIVIIDEASQADITAIPLLFMGKKVIVVGDDEQVSPMAIGIPDEKMNALRATYIKGRIPNWHLYDATYSIYALACSICKPLMLREHFRCVPDIIGYSNWLSYEGKIRPLREAGSTVIQPAVVPYRIQGQRKGKINLAEAETIVAAIQALMEMPEYRNETFGIISMLGDEQVRLVEKLLFEHISLVDREKRRILCGTASSFQGDERDVVFLSLVDSNEGDGPLRMMTEGKADSTKQRYNVAISRARNQIWIVHSMDPAESLKTGDIRRSLLDYGKDPNSYCQKIKQIERDSESLFEEEVAKSLVTAGYQVTQQYPVGGYRLDMVVSCMGKRIALECDGERYHSSEEEFQNDAERQDILERLGWQFIRLRGSEYFRDKKNAIERIKQSLNEAGIVPETASIGKCEIIQDALKQKVSARIQQIIRSWHLDDDETGNSPIVEKPYIQPHDHWGNEHPAAVSNGVGAFTAIDTPIPTAEKDTAQENSIPAKSSIVPPPVKPTLTSHSGSDTKQVESPAPRVEQIGWDDLDQGLKPKRASEYG